MIYILFFDEKKEKILGSRIVALALKKIREFNIKRVAVSS